MSQNTSDLVAFQWRGTFGSAEVEALHAEAFDHEPVDHDWNAQVEGHSLGWVTVRSEARLVGFVNVAWDGAEHAFVLDTIVATDWRHRGIGTRMVEMTVDQARAAGCEWLHVDFDEDLRGFYLDTCGFTAAPAGLIAL